MHHHGFIACLLLGSISASYAPAQTTAPAPTTHPAHVAATPIAIPGVGNFAMISPILYRGEQPTAEGFAELKKLGVKTVVSLRNFHSDRDLMQGTGLQYVRINSNAWHPEEEDLIVFLKVLSDPANQPVFVHCAHGADRTGFMVASHRIVQLGWTFDEAIAELHLFKFHTVWTKVPEALKQLNPADILEKVRKAPMPKIETVP